jgi:hypothetical protein
VPMWIAPGVGGRDQSASDVASEIAFNRLRRSTLIGSNPGAVVAVSPCHWRSV